jgi:pyruvate dehydrogenase E2 component (dihydrolipoamide acetyltransferase)
MDEGRVLHWLKEIGAEVKRGEAIAEIETDKAVVEMEAFVTGTLVEIVMPEGELVPTGTVIAYIDDGRHEPEPTAATPSLSKPAEPSPPSAVAEAEKPARAVTRINASTPRRSQNVWRTNLVSSWIRWQGRDRVGASARPMWSGTLISVRLSGPRV